MRVIGPKSRTRARVLRQRADGARDKIGEKYHVRIGKGQDRAGDPPGSGIARIRNSRNFWDERPEAIFLGGRHDRFASSVHDHDDLAWRRIQPCDAGQARVQGRTVKVSRDDEADIRRADDGVGRGQSKLGPCPMAGPGCFRRTGAWWTR